VAIKSNLGPPNGHQVMQRALAYRVPQTANIMSTPLGGAPQTGSPIPVYHLPLAQLKDSDPLASAKLTCWSYPVIGGMRPGLADIRENSVDGTTSFAGLSYGILATRFLEASVLAEHSLNAADEEFEPRLLDVPALRFAALWLHGSSTDHFIPLLEGSPPGSAPLKLVANVVADLQSRAIAQSRRAIPTGGGAPGTPTN
jgi:hypothetical protein